MSHQEKSVRYFLCYFFFNNTSTYLVIFYLCKYLLFKNIKYGKVLCYVTDDVGYFLEVSFNQTNSLVGRNHVLDVDVRLSSSVTLHQVKSVVDYTVQIAFVHTSAIFDAVAQILLRLSFQEENSIEHGEKLPKVGDECAT